MEDMFSLVFPVYNESSTLEKNVKKTLVYLDNLKVDYEVIIKEDGSTDNTHKIALKLSKEYDKIRVVHDKKKIGRGQALKKAFASAHGKYVGYMDIDLATNLKHLEVLIKHIKNYDIVAGSRYIKDSKINRSIGRRMLSWLYNYLARFLFKSNIYDHQCGFKAFKKNVILKLNKLSEEKHWFWDTETLILAQKLGYSVKELPVYWSENRRTKVKISSDSINMLIKLLKLRLKLSRFVIQKWRKKE